MPIVPVTDCGKYGVIKDQPAAELPPGAWSDSRNIRFRNGLCEQFEGAVTICTPAAAMYFLASYANATTKYLIQAGTTKVYASPDATQTEITRYTEGVVISSITSVGTTATATTATNHGRTTGDTVSIWGCVPTNYNVTAVITVTGVTTFTYTIVSTGGVAATTIGLYSYNGATSNFTGTQDDKWTGGTLGGILLLNNPVDGLYYWNGDTSTRLRKVPNSFVAYALGIFKNYAVQVAPTVSGVKMTHSVVWSNATEPGAIPTSFTASTTNDAGINPLAETPGPLIDLLQLGEVMLLYKEDAIHEMRYIGGNDVFAFSRIRGTDGVLSRACVIDTPKGHVFFAKTFDVRIHNGGQSESLADGRIKKWLANNIDKTNQTRSFICKHPAKTEVWICHPSVSTGVTCDFAVVWNWEDDTWGIFKFNKDINHAVSGNWPDAIYVAVGRIDGGSDLMATISSGANARTGLVAVSGTSGMLYPATDPYLEREGLHFGDRDTVKFLSRSRWHFSGDVGRTVNIQHGSSMVSNDTLSPTTASAVAYNVSTGNFTNARAVGGRYLYVKVLYDITQTTLYNLRLRSYELDFTLGGKR